MIFERLAYAFVGLFTVYFMAQVTEPQIENLLDHVRSELAEVNLTINQ